MQKFVLFAAFVACAAAAPGVLLQQTPVVAVHSPVVHTVPVVGSKTTITKSSQVVSHGSPVVHAVHTPVVATYPVVKSVVTPVVHAPVVHAPVVHAPLVHAPVVHAVAPVVVKTAPSAVAHSSSVVHHSPIKALPVIAIH
ncbi:pupal cuticle protein G1A-like [Pieris rapae]|uniref:pupal cuticle protein G1A-like n=1 Tax=Pieris rapae TaxID=64459 RepID=UPI001E27D359|nr:pupal cuticle protein G1A-like [Pieris rapae]